MIEHDPFMIRAHVPHWEHCISDYAVASQAARLAFPDRRTMHYGPHEDETLDIFVPPGREPAPIHLFIHGGYWRAFSKDDYAFLAESITAGGAIAAIMNYSLMPATRMDLLVLQARRAACWLANNAVRLGGDPDRLSASGHSAGAHLASFLACRGSHEVTVALPPVRSVLLVSGLYDLEPIARSFLQPELALTPGEIARWSPLRTTPDSSVTWRLLVGSKETPPFHDQAEAFIRRLTNAGASAYLATVPGEDHMTIVRELGRPDTTCAKYLSEVITLSRRA